MTTTLDELFELQTLNECAYEATKQSRWKETTQRYLSNALLFNAALRQEVLSGEYKVSPTIDFEINERGHIRQIEAPVVRDRIVQKTLTKSVLAPSLTNCLIYDNYASLPLRGTSFARKRFEIMLRRFYNKYGCDGYILLIDIRKYFNSIDHNVLKQLIAPRLADHPQEVLDLVNYTIDTSSDTDTGLNLGSEAPQVYAIYYLNLVDTFVKVVKAHKYYGRYMDDIFAIGRTKEELRALLTDIETKLSELHLNVNTKKTHIVKLTHGFTYLQVKYSILPSGRIVKQPTHGKIVRERRRLKAYRRLVDKGRMSAEEVAGCYRSWCGTLIREHNAYKKTLDSLNKLFKSLFPEANNAEKKHKARRTEICNQIWSGLESRDLRYIINNQN